MHSIFFFLLPTNQPAVSQTVRPFASNTGDPTSRGLVPRWLNNCIGNHEACRREHTEITGRPARVVDVGSTGQSIVRLHELGTEEREECYVTLSHRWGIDSDTIPRLTSETRAELFGGFDYQNFPATFRHAIELARELGMKYLWLELVALIRLPFEFLLTFSKVRYASSKTRRRTGWNKE
jgi:hypothetical protein